MATRRHAPPPRTAEPAAPDYAVQLGSITHLLIGLLARDLRGLTAEAVLSEIWAAAGRLATRDRFGSRARAARITAAGAAATYYRYFMPPATWLLAGVEVEIEAGRIDLAWQSPDGVVVFDELKLASGRGRARGAGPTDRQTRRYLAHGDASLGDRFGGVRLVLLGAPRHSMLVGPGALLRRLPDTALWFGQGAA